MDFIITTQITSDYYAKSKPLFDSIKKYWKNRFVVGFIDFLPKGYIGEYYLMEKKDIFTYREGYPKNRTSFVCPQGGEFIDYLNCSDDDVIIQIDADTIMQREMTDEELLNLIPKENEIISVYSANPPSNLYQVALNIKFINPENFKYLENLNEFTGSILIANKKTFTILRDKIISEWDEFIKINSHHAGIQWLISKITHQHLKLKLLNNMYQCANWYIKFNTKISDYKLYFDDKIVIFNHTKYLDGDFIAREITPTWKINLNNMENSITRTDIINMLFDRYQFKSYLEIGVREPAENFDKIRAEFKHSIDPKPLGKCSYIMTSDDFFKNYIKNQTYDVIFVDGMHTAEQSYKDIYNAIKHLNEGGFIVIHDCNPPTEHHIRSYEEYQKTGGQWNGTVFKAFLQIKYELKDWGCFVVDEDWGCGIITKRKLRENNLSSDAYSFSWAEFDKRRKEMLELISYDEYLKFLFKNN